MTTIAIHQPQYLPYLGFFHKLYHSDIFVVLDHVQFQKNGLQNRNKIKNSQGWQWLTVPVMHEFGQAINQVICSQAVNWSTKHWNTLVTNYSRTPYFNTYAPELKKIFDQWYKPQGKPWTQDSVASHGVLNQQGLSPKPTSVGDKNSQSLIELNLELITRVMEKLEIKRKIVYSSQLALKGNKSELLIKICQGTGASHYLSGLGGKDYMDLAAFEKANIKVLWQQFVTPQYNQMFPEAGFFPDLSIVDVLFCCGPKTIRFLK